MIVPNLMADSNIAFHLAFGYLARRDKQQWLGCWSNVVQCKRLSNLVNCILSIANSTKMPYTNKAPPTLPSVFRHVHVKAKGRRRLYVTD